MVNVNAINKKYVNLALFATLLAFIVIMLGAYTRLKDAGLGCPDWPGCYGQLTVPHTQQELMEATQMFPAEPVEATKAWAEMVHRYFAGTLGLFILALAVWAVVRRAKGIVQQPIVIPVLLVALVIFQAALGMWTVTLKLLPLVVMGHLLGGMTLAALLWALTLLSSQWFRPTENYNRLKPWALVGLIIVGLQIFLGGWTTANYASLACAGFPFCNGNLIPPLELQHAFNFFSPIGANYQGGVLDMTARVTIQVMHRFGGFIVFLYVGGLALYLLFSQATRELRGTAIAMLIILLAQLTLGILNVVLMLPLPVAVAHNGGAVLLLLAVVTLVYQTFSKASEVFNP